MKRKHILFVLIVLTLIVFYRNTYAYSKELNNKAYEYPVTVYSPEWRNMHSVEERREACSIPLETLQLMTTDALIETIINYPFFPDIYAYDSLQHGFYALSCYFDGVEVLKNRNDVLISLEQYYSEHKDIYTDTDIKKYNLESLIYYFSHREKIKKYHYLIFKSNKLIGYSETLRDGIDFYNVNDPCIDWPVGNAIYTPNGTEIPLIWIDKEIYYTEYIYDNTIDCKSQNRFYGMTWTSHNTSLTAQNAAMYYFLNAYPSTELIASVNPSYNCHSYAWYSQSTSNNYWINEPYVYIDDGSYSITYNNISAGNKVCYIYIPWAYYLEHSGIVVSPANGTIPMRVISKWGYNGLFTHDLNDCPYVKTDTGIVFYN